MLEYLDNNIKDLFQKDVIFTLKNKTYKRGRLINFKLSGCYLSFILLTEKKKEVFEIPFPFAIRKIDDKLVFDYTLAILAEQDYELLINLKSTSQIKKCKFYDAILTISSLT